MIKLSRTGWNNVIIFSVMLFILLINVTQNKRFGDSPETAVHQDMLLIGEHNIILSLTVNQQTNIERIGRSWRAIPAVITGQPLDMMMQTWHSTKGVVVDKPETVDKSKSIIVSVELAGHSDSEYFALIPMHDSLFIFQQSSQQWFRLPLAMLKQLVPSQVII
jgi:hypothetical protein